jgi:dihydroxycyclohexadiene carboxylate dehydrogenase
MTSPKVLDPRAAGARRFEGKIAVVAGAGQGIGAATARRFAQEGARVVVADMVEATAEKVCREITDFGEQAVSYVGNLSVRENCQALMQRTMEVFGRIDVLANIVGGTIWSQRFQFYQPEQIIAEVNKSFWPTVWLCWSALPIMIEQKSGAIVNLATHAVASTDRVPYAASKGGVIALTTSLAKEVADLGIRVNVVAPHTTAASDRVTPRDYGVDVPASTPKREDLTPEQREDRQRRTEERRAREIPMGRQAQAEEQAAAIAFLASEDASFITGQVLPVGGGATYPF